jgi:hypothetical protein
MGLHSFLALSIDTIRFHVRRIYERLHVHSRSAAVQGAARRMDSLGTPPHIQKPFPSNPLAVVTSPVEVRVNGRTAEVLGAVGLPGTVDGYQVNFRVPAGTLKGSATLQLSVGMATDTSVKVMVQ